MTLTPLICVTATNEWMVDWDDLFLEENVHKVYHSTYDSRVSRVYVKDVPLEDVIRRCNGRVVVEREPSMWIDDPERSHTEWSVEIYNDYREQ